MPTSLVYFSDMRSSFRENLLSKLIRLMEAAGLENIISPRNLVSIKLHFGEKGNTSFIRPVFIRKIADRITREGAFPFLTDSNTLYSGTRGNSVTHLKTAIENGFAYSVVNVPTIIADGIRGASFQTIEINQEIIKNAYIGAEIVNSDALISVAHFKGHEFTGFGGTIKNIGMGCASRKGKLDQHSDLSPKVKRKKCVGCGECIGHCGQEAIFLKDDLKATIDPQKCIGCGECILVCPNDAVNVRWNADVPRFQKKMVEYVYAVLKNKRDKSLFVNFLMSISPACDCNNHSDTPIVHDIGITASTDPIAIDQASADLVNNTTVSKGSTLKNSIRSGEDKFKALYPKVDWEVQLEHGEKIGLGSRKYELITI